MAETTQDLASIDAEIAALAEKRKAILQQQRAAVLAEMKKTIATYAFTAQELGLASAAKKPRRKRTGTEPITFRDPDTGETWDGELKQRGQKPAWVKARMENGTIEQCRVGAVAQ